MPTGDIKLTLYFEATSAGTLPGLGADGLLNGPKNKLVFIKK